MQYPGFAQARWTDVVAAGNRWGIWVDVEGFSSLFSAGSLAIRGLSELTRLIYTIGTKVFPDDPDRLFAHQIGDGFYIASDFHEPMLDRCVAIAVVLMRGMLEKGFVVRGAIAEGAVADYSGCRPFEVRESAIRHGDSDVVSLGSGIMTLQAVMGQGLINAVVLDKMMSEKGSLLSIGSDKISRLSSDFMVRPIDEAVAAIDWVNSSSPLIDEIATKAGVHKRTSDELLRKLKEYISTHNLSGRWAEPTLRLVGYPPS